MRQCLRRGSVDRRRRPPHPGCAPARWARSRWSTARRRQRCVPASTTADCSRRPARAQCSTVQDRATTPSPPEGDPTRSCLLTAVVTSQVKSTCLRGRCLRLFQPRMPLRVRGLGPVEREELLVRPVTPRSVARKRTMGSMSRGDAQSKSPLPLRASSRRLEPGRQAPGVRKPSGARTR